MSTDDKVVDLQAVKTFFDPNPGEKIYGRGMWPSAPAMPAVVKKVADELDGKTMSLADAAAKIQAATQGQGEVVVLEDCILLHSIPRNSPLANKCISYCWRVIRYK